MLYAFNVGLAMNFKSYKINTYMLVRYIYLLPFVRLKRQLIKIITVPTTFERSGKQKKRSNIWRRRVIQERLQGMTCKWPISVQALISQV